MQTREDVPHLGKMKELVVGVEVVARVVGAFTKRSLEALAGGKSLSGRVVEQALLEGLA